jgi:predicted Zn finger-like uncharacterized protein
MIISCPYCQTRYQVANDALGSAGRKVQCATCRQAWDAKPEPPSHLKLVGGSDENDLLFDDTAEDRLDHAFVEEEKSATARALELTQSLRKQAAAKTIDDIMQSIGGPGPLGPHPVPAEPEPEPLPPPAPIDPAVQRKRQRAFSQRQSSLARTLPLARVRRFARYAGIVLLTAALGGGIWFRTDIVRSWPDLAGVYSAVGLGVNVIGLEIREMRTVRTMRAQGDVMLVSARIHSVAGRAVPIPQVIVTLLDANNLPLYVWSVAPQARELEPGEVVDFETQLSSPPANTASVRLTFANGRNPAQPHAGAKPESTPALPEASSAAPAAEAHQAAPEGAHPPAAEPAAEHPVEVHN